MADLPRSSSAPGSGSRRTTFGLDPTRRQLRARSSNDTPPAAPPAPARTFRALLPPDGEHEAQRVSVEKVLRANGAAWRVRWRDDQGRPTHGSLAVSGTPRPSTSSSSARSAWATATVQNSRETLEEFSKVWWNRHAAPNLQQHTLASYASTLDVHIVPRLGGVRLRALTPDLIAELRAAMSAEGFGDRIRKTLALLQNILERAVECAGLTQTRLAGSASRATAGLALFVRSTPDDRTDARLPVDHGQHLDATLIAVLAYAGLRPGEAIGLRWNDVGERTLLVERAVAFGQLKSTKTGKARTVRLLPSLTRPSPPGDASRPDRPRPISSSPAPTARRGTTTAPQLAQAHLRRGRRRRPAYHARPYDLRHSFVSLLIAQGATVVEVARQAGHAPTMTLDTYAHLFDELADAPNTSADDFIRAARTQERVREVSVLCPRPIPTPTRDQKIPAIP